MKHILFLIFIVMLSGCTDKTKLLRTGNTSITLDTSKSIYISIPKDGRYGNSNYQGSGTNTSQIILMAFSKYSNLVETGHQYQSFRSSLAYAKKNSYKYLIFPTILEWEDRSTEWSGIPDKASIKLVIVDVASSKVMDSIIIKGKSGLATFGGDHPQDLLLKPIKEYTRTIF